MPNNIRTDLAIETREIYRKAQRIDKEVPGVETSTDDTDKDIIITSVKITTDEAANALGKPIGEYITFEAQGLKNDDEELNEKIKIKLADNISKLCKLNKDDSVLIVGLGNWDVTADALGPKVVSEIDITRHLIEYVPQYVEPGTRSVCAVAPGVLGTTGIETGEIIKGVIEKVKPNLVIVIDALAARDMGRVSTTIQIADAGIIPGSGVGNNRNALTKETLGIPVIVVGVPTVVDAATITNDTLEILMDKMSNKETVKKEFDDFIKSVGGENKYKYIKDILEPVEFNYIVTPKDIDEVINNLSSIIAGGINMAMSGEINL